MRHLHLIIYIFICVNFASAQIDVNNVTIARDSFGVPHIFGKTDAETAYGLAYAHCEDDFEHIQEMLIMARGRMGEYKGPQGAITDYFTSAIRVNELVNARYEADLSMNFRGILEAYAQAINAFAQKHKEEILLPSLFPVFGKDIICGYYLFLTNAVGAGQALEAIAEGKPDEYIYNAFIGSNAFAFNKNKTNDGKTYLVINPHVPLEGLLSFYEAHIQSNEGWNFYGALFPLMISPAMGCSNDFGWATTFNWPDYVDIYKMEINPENKYQYKFDGKWLHFERRNVKIKVKRKSVKREELWCVYGPAFKTNKGVYAIRYNNIGNIKAAEEWFKLSKSKSLNEFKATLQQGDLPMFNFMYADKDGNIAHFANAMLPKRSPNYNWQKALPGNTSATLWKEMIPFEKLPQTINPSCGYLYNTNNSPFRNSGEGCNLKQSDYDTLSGWNRNRINNRDLRFNELIRNKKTLSYADIKAIKYDVSYPDKNGGFWKTFSPLLKLDAKKYPEIADAITLMKKWNFSFDANNKSAALILYTFNRLDEIKNEGYNGLETGITYSEEELVACIKRAKKIMLKNFNSIEVSLNKVLMIQRDNRMFPVEGGPETLNAAYCEEAENGILKVQDGDSFIMFASFDKDESFFETVVPYGASRRKGNKHYSDQMNLYSAKKLKKVSLDKIDILNKAEKIYHPY